MDLVYDLQTRLVRTVPDARDSDVMGFSAQHGLLFVSPEWAQQLIHAVDLHSGSREDLKTQFLQFDPRGEWLIIESQGALELHRVAR